MNHTNASSARDVRRWAISLVEPYIPFATAMKREEAFIRWTRENREMAAHWFSGVITSIAMGLPPNDPWKNIDARLGKVASGENPPDSDGATRGDGERFGTVADGTDLCVPLLPDASLDVALVAISDDLTDQQAAFLALAMRLKRDECTAALIEVDDIANVAIPALRWALWRRRALRNGDDYDEHPLAVMLAWIGRAQTLADGGEVDEELIAFQADVDAIDPDEWTRITERNNLPTR
jgi:hypothetical protein